MCASLSIIVVAVAMSVVLLAGACDALLVAWHSWTDSAYWRGHAVGYAKAVRKLSEVAGSEVRQ